MLTHRRPMNERARELQQQLIQAHGHVVDLFKHFLDIDPNTRYAECVCGYRTYISWRSRRSRPRYCRHCGRQVAPPLLEETQ